MVYKQTPESSQISSIGYDADTKIFEIVYKSNQSKYHYKDVSPNLWVEAQNCESIGKFCGAHIKSHKFTKVA